ncbi:MAG: hypothetical protein C0518_06955 [Opitutus sp.]|nr:hypothetical protein [Opitutus sp.]
MRPLTAHPAFGGPITRVQFARDGEWETAWSFAPDRAPGDADWQAYLAGRREVAFEVFFGAAFFGVRITGEEADVIARASACLAATHAARDGIAFFAELKRRTGLGLWGAKVDFAEIGAVNAWRTVGALRFDPQNADAETLLARLESSPLVRNRTHPKAIEFAFAAPVPHWFALPVSRAPAHEFDAALLAAALASVR